MNRLVLNAVQLHTNMLAVGHRDRRFRQGRGRRTNDAFGVDDRGLNNDLSGNVRGIEDRLVVGGALASLDNLAKVENGGIESLRVRSTFSSNTNAKFSLVRSASLWSLWARSKYFTRCRPTASQ